MNANKRILVITIPAWNKHVGANTWEALLEGYNHSLVANICIRPETPDSKVCSRYFYISEINVIKSIYNRSLKTGYERKQNNNETSVVKDDSFINSNIFRRYTQKRPIAALLIRELLWQLGKWKSKELNDFLDDFKPDVILYATQGYVHFNKIVDYCIHRTGAKAIGYFWDDNFSKVRNEGFLLQRFYNNIIRKSIKELVNCTNAFFSINQKMKKEADAFFGINSIVLTKPLNSPPNYQPYELKYPIKMLYTGNLYIGRNDTLMRIAKVMTKLTCSEGVPFIIDVYTNSMLEQKEVNQFASLNCYIHKAIPQNEVIELQKLADVLLFLEAIDGEHALSARLSFSTKLTDYLSTGKCIFAVGNNDTAPIEYLRETGAALVATNDTEIMNGLNELIKSSRCVNDYAQRAAEVGLQNHNKDTIRTSFYETINRLFG